MNNMSNRNNLHGINKKRRRKGGHVLASYLILFAVCTAALASLFIFYSLKSNEQVKDGNGKSQEAFAEKDKDNASGDKKDNVSKDDGQKTDDEEPEVIPEDKPVVTYKPQPQQDGTVYDSVILNARLINPETNSDLTGYNIGIKDGKIAALTKRPIQGTQTIDAAGLVASPGFIDIDSYEPNTVGVKYKLADGVTTNLCMHGGAKNAKSMYGYYVNYPPLINFGFSNFITQIRADLGYGISSVMTKQADIDKLCQIVEQNLKDGALGISMSPEYAPGVQGAEQLALSKLAKQYNVTTYYHLRYSTTEGENNSLKAIQEVIDIMKETGVSTHILHISSTGATYCTDEAYALVENAQAEGYDLTADIYPYDSWATYLGSMRFAAGWQQRFGLTYGDLQIANSSERITADTFSQYRSQNKLVIANGSIPEAEVRIALKKPYVFIASDTIIEPSLDDHPRGSGCFARLIGKYARDEQVITLMEAVAKATILPAKRLESGSDDIKRKGRLEIGADADIVLFDYNTIIDTATNENVASFSKGIEYVFVNGVLAYTPSGIKSNTFPGKPVYSSLKNPAAPEVFTSQTLMKDGAEAGTIQAFELFGIKFIDLKEAADILGINYNCGQDGSIAFGYAKLNMGETGYTSYGQDSNLLHEPVIYKSSVYIPFEDLANLYLSK